MKGMLEVAVVDLGQQKASAAAGHGVTVDLVGDSEAAVAERLDVEPSDLERP